MTVQNQASMAMLSMIMYDTRQQVMAVQAAPPPASAPATEHADVILSLSTAAQALTSTG